MAQDELGVLFRAIDTESGRMVELRRFFPFGRDGGGLEDQETADYRTAVEELIGLRDPSLRAVLDGGCDPVDGMPYLASEWIEGETLEALLGRGECEVDAVVDLVDRALQLCGVISAKLGTEAVWLDMSPPTVVLDFCPGGRGVTFGISALRWLVTTRDRQSLEPFAVLAEEIMGWRGRLVSEQAGAGLGGWIKWVRQHAQSATQAEARMALARMTGRVAPELAPPAAPAAARVVSAPVPSSPAAATATQRVTAPTVAMPLPMGGLPRQEPKSGKLWIVIPVLVALIGGVVWWAVANKGKTGDAVAALPPPTNARLDEVNARAAKYAAGGAPSASSTVFAVGDDQAIRNENGNVITVEGVVRRVYASQSGKTLYLEFAGAEMPDQVRGRVVTADLPDLTEAALKHFDGKRVRVTGEVRIVQGRAEITLREKSAIKEPS